LFDIQVPTDSAYGKYNILAGTRNDLIVNLPDNLPLVGLPISQADMQALQSAFPNLGENKSIQGMRLLII
jgi:hypothetical protein